MQQPQTGSLAPNTPANQTQRRPAQDEPPGSWRHPALDQASRGMRLYGLNENTFKRFLQNALAFVVLEAVQNTVKAYVPLDLTYFLLALRVLFAANILIAIWWMTRPTETPEIQSLTPRQRKLLGLGESPNRSVPASPSFTNVTPPRYQRSSPSQSPRQSPVVRRGSDAAQNQLVRQPSASPPVSQQKSLTVNKRYSFRASSSVLGRSTSRSSPLSNHLGKYVA